METRRTPTAGLLVGLIVTLSAVAVYSGYTILQLRGLRRLQTETIDRNRADSLLLLRIQNNLNSLALTMRDMLDASEPYPLTAWRGQLRRIQQDLANAMDRDDRLLGITSDQRRYLSSSVAQFWDALDRIFAVAQDGREKEARTLIRVSLQSRQQALSTAVARLLVQNNESEQQAASQTREIYSRAERNAYLFLTLMLLLIAVSGLYLVQWNRRMFAQVAALSERRSELARQLILIQENTFRHISRELHDEFGQILTAVGAILHRTSRRNRPGDLAFRADLDEVRTTVQSALDKVRTLSQELHPAVLDDAGLEEALTAYVPRFERQTGIEVRYEKDGMSRPMHRDVAIHVYRILQEALNNVARHSKCAHAAVRLRFSSDCVVLEVEDDGVGFETKKNGRGMGMVSMRERAELLKGRIEFLKQETGALVRLTVPLSSEEAAYASA